MTVISKIISPSKRTLLVLFIFFSSFPLFAADYYWVGGSGNWSDISHWATSSGGGTMFFTAPTAADNIHFDANSFALTGQTVNINTTAVCRDLNWTGAKNNPAFTCSAAYSLRIYGSLTFIAGMTLNFTGSVYFESTIPGKTITSGGKTFGENVYLQGIGGGWTLTDPMSVTGILSFSSGSFNTNNNSLSCGIFNSDYTTTRTLTIANTTVMVKMWTLNGTSLTFDASNSFINASTNFTQSGIFQNYNNVKTAALAGGGSNFNLITGSPGISASGILNADSITATGALSVSASFVNVILAHGNASLGTGIKFKKVVIDSLAVIGAIGRIDYLWVGTDVSITGPVQAGTAIIGGNGTFSSSNSFDTLTLAIGKIYVLEKATTQTIITKLTVNGKCSGYTTLQSSESGTTANISKASGNVTSNYLMLKDISAIGAALFVANNSVDLGNNTGWTINSVSQTDLYWVGGKGNWTDSSHWSTVSGGVGGACLPNPSVNVHFDANSFSAPGQSVTIDVSIVYCKDMIWSSAFYNPTFKSTVGQTLHIYSSLNFILGMSLSFFGDIYFESPALGKTISTASIPIDGNIYFMGNSGGWKLLDKLDVKGIIYFNKGNLNTNNKIVKCSLFSATDSSFRSLFITNSTIITSKWDINGKNLTFDASNSLITDITEFSHSNSPKIYNNVSSTFPSITFKGGGSKFNVILISSGSLYLSNNNIIDSLLVYNSLYLNDNDTINYLYVKEFALLGNFNLPFHQTINKAILEGIGYVYGDNNIKYLRINKYGLIEGNNVIGHALLFSDGDLNENNQFDTLSLFASNIYKLESNKTQTIISQLNLNGRCSAYITLTSSDIGSTATISKAAAAVTGNYLILKDIKATGGAVFTANNSIGVGSNPGWIINSLSPANLYWVGGTGNWSDSSHWATVSGGVGSSCIPGPFDNVFFDSNSFTATGQMVSMNINVANCNNMVWTGSLFNPTFSLSSGKSIHIFGSLTLVPAMIFAFDGFAYFDATTAGKFLTSAGKKFNADIHFTGQGGEWTLLDSLTVGSSINFVNGKFNSNSNKVSCSNFNSFVSTLRTINISNSVFSVKTWGIIGLNLTFIATNSQLKNLSSLTHFFDRVSYNNLAAGSSSLSVKGAGSSFNLITVAAGSLQIQGSNLIDSVHVNGNLTISDNNTINYIYAKGAALFGNASSKQNIKKAIVDSSVTVYGNNKFNYFKIGDVALIDGIDTMGSVMIKGNASFYGNSIYDSLILSSGKAYLLQAGSTQTIKSHIVLSGNNCFPTSIHSNTVGSFSTIYKSTGKVSADFLELRDIKATGGATFFAGSHSSNLGNNPGWSFSTAPDFIYGLGKDTSLCFGDYLRTSNFNGAKTFIWQDSSSKPYFRVSKPGAYWVKAAFGLGCAYTDTIVISKVFPRPDAGFLLNDSMQCLSSNIFVFTDTSFIDSGSISGYKWYYGDGQSDSIPNPTHVFSTTDTFNLQMIATSSLGCKDTVTKKLYVYNPAKASFKINNKIQCLLGNNFIFTNTSINQPIGSKYSWDFGDGKKDTLLNTTHTYLNPDTFTVSLTVLSNPGCNDSFSTLVYVYPSGVASFSIDDTLQCLSGNKFHFKDNNPGDTLWNWDLGDGKTSTLDSFSYTYSTTDTFRVKLTVTSIAGCRDSLLRTVYVYPSPKANFITIDSSQCLKGNNFSFVPNKSGKDVKDIFWDFGDSITSAIDSPSHSYKYSGNYTVKTIFVSSLGCSDSVSQKMYVNPMPIAIFNVYDSSQCFERNDFGFTNSSKISFGTLSYLWNFGDSLTSVLINPHHTYAYADTFIVKLKVSSVEGCTDSFEKHTFLSVHPKPLADYFINDTIQCLNGNKFNFTNNSTIKSGSFQQFWDFNDGTISDSFNTSHTYSSYDTFTTKLLIISDWACKDSILKKVYVNPMPKADFSININPQTLTGNSFQFTNLSNIPYGNLTNEWNFGDGNKSTLLNGTHSYSLPDSFDVKLSIISDAGCADSITKQVYLLFNVSVDFTAKHFCLGDTVLFESFCNALPDSFRNYLWDFGDGATIVRNNPRHIYPDTGSYNVSLVGLTYLGYKDTAMHTITIIPKPALTISYYKDKAFYPGGSSTLTANGIFDSIFWSTGETSTDIVVRSAGNYIVRVIASNGCVASDSIAITILEKTSFGATNVITPNEDGFNDVWKVADIDQYRPCKAKIFNRWGDELFSSDDYQNNWNGTYKGKKLPEGTYYYYFETKDGVVFKGAINVLK